MSVFYSCSKCKREFVGEKEDRVYHTAEEHVKNAHGEDLSKDEFDEKKEVSE